MGLATILLLGAAQAAFLVALLLGKRGKTLPDGVLATWIAILGAHHLLHALFLQGVAVPSAALNVNAGVPLLQGPLLFLYVDTLTSGRRRLRRSDSLHLVPFVAFAVFVLLLLPRLDTQHGSVSLFQLSDLITLAILVSVPAYAAAALVHLRRHGRATLERHSERQGRDLSWLRNIVLALLGVWVVVIGITVSTRLAPDLLPHGAGHQVLTAVTLFIYAIGYFGWRQFAVVEAPPERETSAAAEVSQKYERSGLGDTELQALVLRLEDHLERDRPYLEPGLTLHDVSEHLGASSNHLSQAINQGMGRNFYELINQRRVDSFTQMALEPRNQHRNLLAIAFDSGFSSKSSFNRVFKQITGMSPRQYLEAARSG